MKAPPVKIEILDIVIREDITYFAHYAAPLGDINGDGYDDFAVSSKADSTFIFLGGTPVPSHEYSWVVRGGSTGVRSADFNRDGKMDIVTSIVCIKGAGEGEPERRGTIRIYLQKEGPIPFTWEADMVIMGDSGVYLAGGSVDAARGAVRILDYNGDGWPDLLTKQEDTRDSATTKAVVFLGSPEGFSAHPEVEFRVRRFTGLSTSYADKMRVGDFNGDGRDDILLNGIWPSPPNNRVDYWDIFLGNAEGRAGEADRVLRSDTGWMPSYDYDVMDIDGDGYCDIIDTELSKPFDGFWYGNNQVFRGGPDLPDLILPNDSIPNLNPYEWGDRNAVAIEPIGDMNGDGTPDMLINWDAPTNPSYYYYPGGQGFRNPIGYFGTISSLTYVTDQVEIIGDVNGDGYDDLMQLGQPGEKHSNRCRYRLMSGSPELRARPNAIAQIVPSSTSLTLSPNPVPLSTQLQLDASGLGPGTSMLTVTDMLGRTQRSAQISTVDGVVRFALDTTGFAPGVYLVSLLQGSTQLSTNFVVY